MASAYIVTNLITGSITITPSTEDAIYTRASLYDGFINKPFRWTAKENNTLLFDFGGAVTIDLIVLLQHNFTSNVVATLTSGTTSACDDGYSGTITYAATNTYTSITPTSNRYWKLEIDDAGCSSNSELCEIYMGVDVPFSKMYSHGWEEGLVHMNDERITEFGNELVYEKYSIRTYRLPWNACTSTVRDEIKTLITATKRNLTSFVLIPDTSANDCVFGKIRNPYGAVAYPEKFYSTGIEFREVSAGKAVVA